jgi:hypothetical protein
MSHFWLNGASIWAKKSRSWWDQMEIREYNRTLVESNECTDPDLLNGISFAIVKIKSVSMNISKLNMKKASGVAALFILLLASCSKKINFSTSTVVPAATGAVKIKKDNNNNYALNVSLRNLAPSTRLTPPRPLYIVWVDTESNGVKNIGQVNTSSGVFSKKLKASLEAHLPFKPTRVFITAEDLQTIQYPGGQVILSTKSF